MGQVVPAPVGNACPAVVIGLGAALVKSALHNVQASQSAANFSLLAIIIVRFLYSVCIEVYDVDSLFPREGEAAKFTHRLHIRKLTKANLIDRPL